MLMSAVAYYHHYYYYYYQSKSMYIGAILENLDIKFIFWGTK